jgi:tetratricopeptide (TPR) repeat protein
VLAAAGIALVRDAPPTLHAQAENGWIGQRVVPRYSHFTLRFENQVIDPKAIKIYRVEQVNGPWLWLHAGELSGWALAEHVVAVEQAIQFFTDYIEANPGDPHGFTMRALIWWRENRELDIALGDYAEAIRLDPTKAYVYINRGNAWAAKREYDKALADYDEAIRIDPKYAPAYVGRGLAWKGKKEYDKALADYDEAIRIDPKYTLAYVGRGLAWKGKKEYDKALADYDEAIRIDPKHAPAYNGRAWLWATCPDAKYRDGKEAVESATRACELTEWRDPNDIATLAAAHAEAGDFTAVVKWQAKAIEQLTDEKAKDDSRSRLKLYQEKKPYREMKP